MTRLAPCLVALALLDGCVWSSPATRETLDAQGYEHPGIHFRVPSAGDAEHFISTEWRVKHPVDLWGRPHPNALRNGELTIEHLATGAEIWVGVIDMLDDDVQSLALDAIAERVLRASQEPSWRGGPNAKAWGYREPMQSFELSLRDRAELTIVGREAYALLVDVFPTDREHTGVAPVRAMFVFIRTNDLTPYRRGRQTRGVPALIIAGMAAPIEHFDRIAGDFTKFLASFDLPAHERAAPATATAPAPAGPPAEPDLVVPTPPAPAPAQPVTPAPTPVPSDDGAI